MWALLAGLGVAGAGLPYVTDLQDEGARFRARGLLHVAGAELHMELPRSPFSAPEPCITTFQEGVLASASLRLHTFGTPIFDFDEELQVTADSRLRVCWRNPDDCWAAVALLEYTDQLDDFRLDSVDSPTGSATLLILAPPSCTLQDVALHAAPAVLEATAGSRSYAVVSVSVQEVKPGAFEQHRTHRNLSRWIPPYPDGPPYPEEVVGFGDECLRAALGPMDDTADTHFHKIFGRVLCSPSAWSRPEDFEGEAAGLKIYVQPLPGILNADRLVAASLVRLAYDFDCDAGLFLCSERRWDGAWSTWRQYVGEVVLLQKFLTAPRHVLVDSAKEADIIVVPLLSQFVSSWLVFKQAARGCPRELLKYVKHLEWPQKYGTHVFLFADHMMNLREHDPGGMMSLFALQAEIIFISHGTELASPAHITMPSVLTDADLQPASEAAAASERDIFLIYSETVDCCHPVRKHFYEVLTSDQGKALCGETCVVETRTRSKPTDASERSRQTHGLSEAAMANFNEAMKRAKFCPMGPGDTPHRHKFFHAFLAGCIPVLFDFASYFPGHRSWWREFGSPYQLSLPFPEDIPYEDIVVTVPCTQNYTESSLQMLQRLKTMPSQELERRQELLRSSRHFLAFQWRGDSPDAFTAIMQRIGRAVRKRPQIR
ncbi:unnamed protein product [Effrenium voratum]|nr:unnamed protein product [Effrenium voratum]